MSLVGNLEDLGLGDILQIVSLSRKSGVLVLNSRERQGQIIFLNGQVIQATSSQIRENLGDLLLHQGLVSQEVLNKALFIQRNSERSPRLGAILADRFEVPREKIEAAVKGQVEKIVYSFFDWNVGGFSFEVGEPEELAATSFSPLDFMLAQGLSPQWLAMEGSRILDEMRHRGETFPAPPEPEPAPGSAPLPAEPPQRAAVANGEAEPAVQPLPALDAADGPSLLLVDDDPQTAALLTTLFRERGLNAAACASGREFLAAVARAAAAGERPLLVVDLLMPRLDGSGVLGGVELLAEIRRRFPQLAVMMISDHPNVEASERVRRLGVEEVLVKPRPGDLHSERGHRLLVQLGDAVAASTGKAPPADLASHVNLGAELFRELGVEPACAAPAGPLQTPGLRLLRGMLQELHNPTLGGGIILLALRFASELMNRAVVFSLKNDQVMGLGQFGIEGEGSADARIRQIHIPLAAESVFARVVSEMLPLRARLGEGRWDAYLQQQLGGGRAEEVFLGPILSEGNVVAILYGDNYPAREPIGDTESLEIFLSQAGLAMEKALLERRLRGRDGDR